MSWVNDGIVLRTFTKAIEKSSQIDLKTFDNGIEMTNPNIEVYGQGFSTKNNIREFFTEIEKVSNNVYNIECKGGVWNKKTVNKENIDTSAGNSIIPIPIIPAGQYRDIRFSVLVEAFVWGEIYPVIGQYTLKLEGIGEVSFYVGEYPNIWVINKTNTTFCDVGFHDTGYPFYNKFTSTVAQFDVNLIKGNIIETKLIKISAGQNKFLSRVKFVVEYYDISQKSEVEVDSIVFISENENI